MDKKDIELYDEALAIIDDNLQVVEGIIGNRFVTASLIVEFAKKQVKNLAIHGVVLQSEQLPKNNCTLNRQTCGKGSGCKYPHCHI